MTSYTARISQSKVMYFHSAGQSLLEKYAIGRQPSPVYCCRTAPTAHSEAPAIFQVGPCGDRRVKSFLIAAVCCLIPRKLMCAAPCCEGEIVEWFRKHGTVCESVVEVDQAEIFLVLPEQSTLREVPDGPAPCLEGVSALCSHSMAQEIEF